MICKNCGASIPENTSFCNNCGAKNETVFVSQAQPDQQNVGYGNSQNYNYAAPQPQYNTYSNYNIDEPLSVGQYIGIFLLSAIPIAGFILMLVWAFSSNENTNKKNYARATLILYLVALGLWILLAIGAVGCAGLLSQSFRF